MIWVSDETQIRYNYRSCHLLLLLAHVCVKPWGAIITFMVNAVDSELNINDQAILLLVDDDPLISESLGFMLGQHFQVVLAESRNQALDTLTKTNVSPDIALVDLGLPPQPHRPDEGFSLINELLAKNPQMKILVLSGQDDDVNIQHALTLGAVDFVSKPAEPKLLLSRLQHHRRLQEIELKKAVQDEAEIIYQSSAMDVVAKQISQFADAPFPVLIEGESGTGKEKIARALHVQSKRKNEPYLVINCASIAPDLLEAQLFGHVKGAFTGAVSEHKGFFIEAGEGTLFLDEIGELPISLQSKLLRVIENGEFYRVGETQQLKSKARIVAATNKTLNEEVIKGDFRADLYHRLGILSITVPPLRNRGDDVFLLLNHFQSTYADTVAPFTLDDEAKQLWAGYEFPGNVRELRNIVIRLGTKYPGMQVNRAQLEAELETQMAAGSLAEASPILSDDYVEQQIRSGQFSLNDALEDIEGRCIRIALEMNNNSISKAAEALKVNRTTLYSRVTKLGQK